MSRRSLVPLLVLLGLLTLPSGAPAAGFTYGVAAGDVTSTSARVWARAPRTGIVTVEVTLPHQAKDQNGQPVREEEGSQPPCPTITLNKK